MVQKEKTAGAGASHSGIMALLGSFLGGVPSVIHTMLEHLRQGTQALTQKIMRRIGLLFFSVLGVIFVLIGGARMLDEMYQLPGLGEVVVGVFIFSLSLLVYILDREKE